MKQLGRVVCMVVLASVANGALAYKESTHEDMSEVAAFASVLANPDTLSVLGLRYGIDDEKQKFPNSEGKEKTIKFLIRDGARFEDNFPRSLNHFFDPLNDKGLGGVNTKSPDWALEDKGDIDGQAFSFKRARQYFYDALTKMDQIERDRNFGRTFQTLGQVIHHLQDMTQPQHVRNDNHCDILPCLLWPGLHNPSRYEKYTDEQREKGKLPFDGYAPVNSKDDWSFLKTARAFWHTQDKNPVAGQGVAEFTNTNFLSAGTNFDSPVYPAPHFDPATEHDENTNTLLQNAGLTIPPECLPPNGPCSMTFYRNEVRDNYRPAETRTNDYASTWSIFDQDLRVQNKRAFSLNRFNFDAAHEFLIPRAVAYSAGLIDYFFRGKLEAEQTTFIDDGTNLTVTLHVKNAIEPNGPAAWRAEALTALSGENKSVFTLACQYKLNGQDQFTASQEVVMDANSDPVISPGQVSNQSYTFILPSVPVAATAVQYRLVFRGKLGQEEGAVAVGSADPVSGFLVTPNYVPNDGIEGKRAIAKKGSVWQLDPNTSRVAGNIDWKGWYVGGRPTKVLSWSGPKARYFGNYSGKFDARFTFRREIFQAGEVFAVAPYPVLGAALTRDASGTEWLIAVCQNGADDVTLKRPNIKSDSPDFYDPVYAPDGWREIGRSNAIAMLGVYMDPDVPWLFNGEGTEAQTVRRKLELSIVGGRGSWRYVGSEILKISINNGSVTLLPLGNLPGIKVKSMCTISQPPSGCNWDASNNLSRIRSGEYVVAVDYVDNQEVRAVVKDNRLDSSDLTASSSNSDPACHGTTTTNVARHTAQSGQLYLDVGSRSVVLNRISGGGAYEVHAVDNHTPASGPTGTATASMSLTVEHGNIDSLDLRYGLIAGAQSIMAYVGSGSHVESGGYPYSTPYAISADQHFTRAVNSDIGNLTVYSISSSSTLQSSVSLDTSFSLDLCLNAGETVELPDPADIVTATPGAWLVDTNRNLFVSQEYRDVNFMAQTFNYLTGGDLTQLIPTAPQDALYYYPSGVIR